MHFFVEVEEVDGFRMVRAHRIWVGRFPKESETRTFEKIELPEYESDDPTLFAIQLESDEIPEGQSTRLKGGLVLTSEPQRYGDPAAREAAGKKSSVRLLFEEWVAIL